MVCLEDLKQLSVNYFRIGGKKMSNKDVGLCLMFLGCGLLCAVISNRSGEPALWGFYTGMLTMLALFFYLWGVTNGKS